MEVSFGYFREKSVFGQFLSKTNLFIYLFFLFSCRFNPILTNFRSNFHSIINFSSKSYRPRNKQTRPWRASVKLFTIYWKKYNKIEWNISQQEYRNPKAGHLQKIQILIHFQSVKFQWRGKASRCGNGNRCSYIPRK